MKAVLILTTILLMSLVSSLYAGETGILYSGINGDLTSWTAEGNITSLENINITQNGSNIYIELPSDFTPQNIVFTLTSGEEVVQTSSSGSSGSSHSSSKTKYIPWCLNWTECLNNYQERYCFTEESTNKETRVCGELPKAEVKEVIVIGEEEIPEEKSNFIYWLIGGIIVLGVIGIVVWKFIW